MQPMCKRSLSLLVSASLLLSALGASAAEQVIISEFMASNNSGLRDEDNQLADWIEIYNSGTNAVNLDGWFLTDNSNNKTKWRFPATNIASGGFVIVFADSKDRRVPGAPLHANFALSAGGEYLGLIKPDGVTVATEFVQVNNGYPGQAPDVSYGFSSLTTNFNAILTNSPVRWRIPDGTEGDWQTNTFDDSSWAIGTNGVGFGSFSTANYGLSVLPTGPVGYWRLEETSGSTAANIGSGASPGTYVGATLGVPGPRPPSFNGFEPNNNAASFNGSHVAGPASLLSGRNAFTVAGWINPQGTQAARTGLFGQNDCVEFGFISATTLECWTPGGGSLTAVPYPHPINQWHHVAAVADGVNIRIYIDGQLAGTGGSPTASYGTSTFNFNIGGGGIQDATGNSFNGLIDEVLVYHRALSAAEVLGLFQSGTNASGSLSSSFVRTDVSGSMSNLSSSAYVRIPFVIANPTNASLVSLRMRYNDGFAAYINGFSALRVNAPATNVFDSVATNLHLSAALEIFPPLGAGALVAGTNILAIHGLNIAPDDTNFLVEAQMTITSVEAASSTPLFFTAPTPGAPNIGGIANPGPSVTEVTHVPNVPSDNENVTVSARITPTFYPVSNVVVRYRVMFGTEFQLPMFDDGLHGDGAAADGVWGATLPIAVSSTNGQMIRWFFRAFDNRGNTSRYPVFASTVASAEYLGTVVNPSYVTSKIPIVHLFAPSTTLNPGPDATGDQPGADSQAGGRVSVFYDGEFYDNIHMELRGNSTSGFRKKSHRLEFNREHAFRHLDGFPRIRKTSFVADYPDPTYMRQGLGYWLCDVFGAAAPFYYPVRLQLNGNFYQLANHNDVHGEELLERIGFDPNGALYNAAGQVTIGKASTGGFDKKTRTWENHADYTNLAVRVSETNTLAQRHTNVFDIFDVPQALNYLVAARWFHENDDVWANLSLYFDNDGDQLWRIVPFDVNLSWGAIFAEGDPSLYTGVQATNDTHKAHPLYGGANILARSGPGGAFNRVYDTFFKVPQLREMFLRRMRTLLDTYVGPIGTPTNSTALEQMILAHRDLIAEEAIRDRAWWNWPGVGGQNNFAQGIDITNGVNQLLDQFIRTRRVHFYGKHSITNTALPLFDGIITPATNTVAGIPLAQPSNVVINIAQMESNPSSGNQGHEFIQLTNANPFAVDISGWKLSNGVNFTFKPGTVIPSNSVLYVTPDLQAYRTRTTAPMPGRGLFVVGDYGGQMDARGEMIVLLDNSGRVVHTNTYAPSPSPAQLYLRITELMYAPARTNAGSPYGTEEFEYLELKNVGPASLDLVGVHFTNGITFAFTTNSAITNLLPGQNIVLVKNTTAYFSRYGTGALIAGVYTGSLDNNGERISLRDRVGEQVLDFTYDNEWYPTTDGLGFSLVIVNEDADWTTWNLKESWRPSSVNVGSPGSDDPPLEGPFAAVLVNEVLTHTDFPDLDRIEIYNSTTNDVDIGNWWISDDYFRPQKYRIPAPAIVPAGGFAVFSESDFNVGPTAFSFSSQGDEAYIFSGNAQGHLNGYLHGFDFGAAATGESFGRYTNSQTNIFFTAQASNTFTMQNGSPRVGPVVISEIMYHPADALGVADSEIDEFIELHNITETNVALHNLAFPGNRWKLDDGVEYTFSVADVIPPNGFLLVVNFNPTTEPTRLANFRAKYGVPNDVAVVGPYSGRLNNDGEPVELHRPDAPESGDVPFILVERVRYSDALPWDTNADGYGPSLQRFVVSSFGNDPTNWFAALPSAGRPSSPGAPPVITSQPQDTIVVERAETNLTVSVTGNPPFRYQWLRNGVTLPGETNANLSFNDTTLSQTGSYSVVVFNSGGVVVSSNALVTVLALPVIVQQPVSQNVATNITVNLSVGATGTGLLRYQWYFNNSPILNATNANYSFSNSELFAHSGHYYAVVTDDVGSEQSAAATIVVMTRPYVTNNPVPQVIVRGGNAFFTVGAAPNHPLLPLSYRWLTNGVLYQSNLYPDVVVTNRLTNGTIRCQVVNAAGNVNSSTVALTVLADADGDRMPDIFEQQYGFSSTNAADALLDSDLDGMNNRDELIAGTNPTNALSVLKIITSAANDAILEFVAQTNNGYQLQYRTNLESAIWNTLTTVPPHTSLVRTIQFEAPKPPPEGTRYYRVATPPLP